MTTLSLTSQRGHQLIDGLLLSKDCHAPQNVSALFGPEILHACSMRFARSSILKNVFVGRYVFELRRPQVHGSNKRGHNLHYVGFFLLCLKTAVIIPISM